MKGLDAAAIGLLVMILGWLTLDTIWTRATRFTATDGIELEQRIVALRAYVDRLFFTRVPAPELCVAVNRLEERLAAIEGREPIIMPCRIVTDTIMVFDTVPGSEP